MKNFNYLTNYEFKPKEHQIEEYVNGELIKQKVISIGIHLKDLDITIPHPLTNFICTQYEYNGAELNSSRAPSYTICRFLNYIIKQIVIEDDEFTPLLYEGLSGLTLLHGSRYITYLTTNRKLKRKTVHYYEGYLKDFYLFLTKHSLLKEKYDFSPFLDGEKWTGSPFRNSDLGTKYPSKKHNNNKPMKLKNFGPNMYELIVDFLEEAKEIAPEIAFALCLQFFGGLRRGEVVNLTRAELNVKVRNSLSVNIRDNRDNLFKRLKNTSSEGVKRLNYLDVSMAKQMILDSDLLWDYYEDHMKDLQIKIKNNFIKDPNILFYDSNGQAMSGKVLERRFKKVKKAFLKKLQNTPGREDDYFIVKESFWSTHIGRGMFTEILFDIGLNIVQVAIARGDTSLSSVIDYVDQKNTILNINELINELSETPINKFGTIDGNLYNNNWINGVSQRVRKSR